MRQGEGLNFKEQGGGVKLDVAMNPDGGANLSALNCVTSPGHQFLELKCLNLFEEAPRAEPHAGCWCDSLSVNHGNQPVHNLTTLASHKALKE
jgi:hypothetical protein